MDALWFALSLPSRLFNAATGGSFWATACLRSLRPDAPLWLRVIAAAVEERMPGHLASTVDYPEPERDPHHDTF